MYPNYEKPVLWKFKKKSSEIEGKCVERAVLTDFLPTIESKEPVRLDEQENTEEPKENKDITHKERFFFFFFLVSKN